MYLRTTQRRNKNGSTVRYVQLAHNRRVDGVTQAEVLVPLGREDTLDRDGLVRLVASINRYLGLPQAGMPADAVELVGDGLTVAGSRPMGTAYLLDGLWRQLGVDTALRRVLGSRRFTTDVERVLFALVANRAIDPASKLAAAEWASCDVAVPGLAGMDEDQAYRAMDLLVEADASCTPPPSPPPKPALLAPARCPHAPSSPPSTPPDQHKHRPRRRLTAWTHDPSPDQHAFSQVNPRIQALRVPTNCGTRVDLGAQPAAGAAQSLPITGFAPPRLGIRVIRPRPPDARRPRRARRRWRGVGRHSVGQRDGQHRRRHVARRFATRPRRMVMGAHHGGVHRHHPRLLASVAAALQPTERPRPRPIGRPAPMPVVHGLPAAVGRRQIPPRRPRPGPPQHTVHHRPVVLPRASPTPPVAGSRGPRNTGLSC